MATTKVTVPLERTEPFCNCLSMGGTCDVCWPPHGPKHKKVEDFKGVVDGGGYKASMDSPKTPLELISPEFLTAIADVLQHGKMKYAANNWMRGMSYVCVFGSILRHLFAWAIGDQLDRDSNLPHLHHAACGLMFLIYFTTTGSYEKFDDRVFNR